MILCFKTGNCDIAYLKTAEGVLMRRLVKPVPKPLLVKSASSKSGKGGFVCPSSEVFLAWSLFLVSSVAWIGATKTLLRGDLPVTVLLAKTVVTFVFLLGQSMLGLSEIAPLATEDAMWWQGLALLHTICKLTVLVSLSVCSLPLFCAVACLAALGYSWASVGKPEESSPGSVVLGAVVLVGVVLLGFQTGSRLSSVSWAAIGGSIVSFWLLLFFQRRGAAALWNDQSAGSSTMEFYISLGSFPILVGLYCWGSEDTNLGLFSVFAAAPFSELSGMGKALLVVVVVLENIKVRTNRKKKKKKKKRNHCTHQCLEKSRTGSQLLTRASIRLFVGTELLANFVSLLLSSMGLSPFASGDSSVLAVVCLLVVSMCAVAFVPKHALSTKKIHLRDSPEH
jgi:hypothetical protein